MQTNLTTLTFGDTRLPARFWAKVRVRPDGCWQWTGYCNSCGYGRFQIGSLTDKTRRGAAAHRVAYEALIGSIAAELECDHLCRSPSCVNPVHLELVTHAENMRRSPIIGRYGDHARKGEAHGRAKLTEADITIIRALRGYLSQRALAARFRVSESHISKVQLARRWTHHAT